MRRQDPQDHTCQASARLRQIRDAALVHGAPPAALNLNRRARVLLAGLPQPCTLPLMRLLALPVPRARAQRTPSILVRRVRGPAWRLRGAPVTRQASARVRQGVGTPVLGFPGGEPRRGLRARGARWRAHLRQAACAREGRRGGAVSLVAGRYDRRRGEGRRRVRPPARAARRRGSGLRKASPQLRNRNGPHSFQSYIIIYKHKSHTTAGLSRGT